MSVRKYECFQLVALVVPIAAIIAKFFLETRLEFSNSAHPFPTLFGQFAVLASTIGFHESSKLTIEQAFPDNVYFCNDLKLLETRRAQLVENGINVLLPYNDYKIYEELDTEFVAVEFSPEFKQEFENYSDNTRTQFLVWFYDYDTSTCSPTFSKQRYVVVKQQNNKPIEVSYSYKVEVLNEEKIEFAISLCDALFLVSIFAVIFWIYWLYCWRLRRRHKLLYQTENDNGILISYL